MGIYSLHPCIFFSNSCIKLVSAGLAYPCRTRGRGSSKVHAGCIFPDSRGRRSARCHDLATCCRGRPASFTLPVPNPHSRQDSQRCRLTECRMKLQACPTQSMPSRREALNRTLKRSDTGSVATRHSGQLDRYCLHADERGACIAETFAGNFQLPTLPTELPGHRCCAKRVSDPKSGGAVQRLS